MVAGTYNLRENNMSDIGSLALSKNNLGAIVGISVRDAGGNVNLSQIRDAVLNNSLIPDEWAPEALNPLSVYLQTISSIAKSATKHLEIPHGSDFDIVEHGGYIVNKMKYSQGEEIPSIHRIHHKKKLDKTREGQAVRDIDIEDALVVYLRRTFGNMLHDIAGSSTFEICIDKDKVSDENFKYFEPFINTLNIWFDERCAGLYSSDQIRKLFYDCVKSLKSKNILNGMYFIPESDVASIKALSHALTSLHKGIRIVVIPIPKFVEGGDNSTFDEVRPLVEQSLLDELLLLQDEIEALSEVTRDSTWTKKLERWIDLEEQIKSYKTEKIIVESCIDDLAEEIKAALAAHDA